MAGFEIIKKTVSGLRRIGTVAAATALEGMQQPVCVLLSFSVMVVTALQPVVQLYSLGEESRLPRDGGLAFMLVSGLLTVVFTAGFTLSDEIRRGTASASLVKPVGRTLFFLGKFFGVFCVAALFCMLCAVSTVFAERAAEHYAEGTPSGIGFFRDPVCSFIGIASPVLALFVSAVLNWRYRVRQGVGFFFSAAILQIVSFLLLGFFSREGRWLGIGSWTTGSYNLNIFPAAFLILLFLGIYCAMAVALSSRLGTGPALCVCIVMFIAGFPVSALEGTAAGRLAYALIPDVQHFWMADALAGGGMISLKYMLGALAYASCYSAFVLVLGALAFLDRDMD